MFGWRLCLTALLQSYAKTVRKSTRSSAIAEIARVGGHYAVQGHSRSLVLIPLESLHICDFVVNNITNFTSYIAHFPVICSICQIISPLAKGWLSFLGAVYKKAYLSTNCIVSDPAAASAPPPYPVAANPEHIQMTTAPQSQTGEYKHWCDLFADVDYSLLLFHIKWFLYAPSLGSEKIIDVSGNIGKIYRLGRSSGKSAQLEVGERYIQVWAPCPWSRAPPYHWNNLRCGGTLWPIN